MVTTSGSSLRLVTTLMITTARSTTPTTTPIIIFFFLLTAMLWVPLVRTGPVSRSSLYGKTYQTVSFKGNRQSDFEAQTFEMVAALTPETHVGALDTFRARIACFSESV